MSKFEAVALNNATNNSCQETIGFMHIVIDTIIIHDCSDKRISIALTCSKNLLQYDLADIPYLLL